MFSSKGKSEICHDEPVAFFATEEDWYVELEMSVQCTLPKTTYQCTSKLVPTNTLFILRLMDGKIFCFHGMSIHCFVKKIAAFAMFLMLPLNDLY